MAYRSDRLSLLPLRFSKLRKGAILDMNGQRLPGTCNLSCNFASTSHWLDTPSLRFFLPNARFSSSCCSPPTRRPRVGAIAEFLLQNFAVRAENSTAKRHTTKANCECQFCRGSTQDASNQPASKNGKRRVVKELGFPPGWPKRTVISSPGAPHLRTGASRNLRVFVSCPRGNCAVSNSTLG